MSDASVVSIVTGVVTIITLWIKVHYGQEKTEAVAKKVDQNTQITQQGTQAAASAAVEASKKVEVISKKLNGGIDDALHEALEPVKKSIDKHLQDDAEKFEEVKAKFQELTDYVHHRNHEILDALGAVSNQLQVVLRKLGNEPIPDPQRREI